jgi:polar amino acid transport system ATP-binding protein/putative ABC transport system ATP-binding protein
MLKINNISLSYGSQQVLCNFSLNIGTGEVVCLCGESGCGKSSILRSVLGFVEYSGSIEVCGMELGCNTADEIRKSTSYIPQDLSMPYDTVEQMVTNIFLLKANRHAKFSKERLWEDWDLLGLDKDLFYKRTDEISGGQRQRIMLSIAGLTEKKLLLADEPTSALDKESALLVAKYFRELANKRKMAILAVSHSEAFANCCDKTITLLPLNTRNIK